MLSCPKCLRDLPERFFNAPALQPCPACDTKVQALVFPAFWRRQQGGLAAEAVLEEGESSCFYHPESRASITCGNCGRFLCNLCDVDLGDQHLCPSCLNSSHKKRKLTSLENGRVRYDSIALLLSLAPLLIFYFTLITAPITLYLVFKHWKSPLSIVGGTRWRFVVAAIVALLEIAGWIIGVATLLSRP